MKKGRFIRSRTRDKRYFRATAIKPLVRYNLVARGGDYK